MISPAFHNKIIVNKKGVITLSFTYKFVRIISKILFSAVVFQLFLIILGAESGAFSPSDITAALEHSAMSCNVALGGQVLMEYVLKNEAN